MADFNLEAAFEVDRNEISRELREMRGEADRAERAVDDLGRESQQAGRKIDRMGRESREARREIDGLRREGTEAAGAMRLLGGLVAGVSFALVAHQVLRMTDAMKEMQSQLRIVTDGQEDLNSAMEGTLGVANATRSSLDATVTLYARLARSTEQLGVEQSELLGITQTINEAFIVSGATAQEAGNAIVQLSQGLASGQLRGEEFRSVAEQAPRLLQAMAEELDKTRGELMEMAFAGELTTDVIVRALGSQSEAARAIHDDFQDVEQTVAQAMTVATNNLTVFVSSMDEASGMSSALVVSINLLSDAIELLNTALENNNTILGNLQTATDDQASWYDRLAAAADLASLNIFNQAELIPTLISLLQQMGEQSMTAADAQRELAAASGGVVQTLGPMTSLGEIVGGMVAPALEQMGDHLATIREQRMEAQITSLMDRLIDATPIIGQTGSAARETAGDFMGLGEAIRGATEDAREYAEAVEERIGDVESATRTELEQIEATRRERIAAINEARELGIRSAEELADLRLRVEREYIEDVQGLQESYLIDLQDLQIEIAKNALRSIQEATSDFFETIIREGELSWSTLWSAFENLAIRAISNILGAITTNLFAQVINQATGGALESLLGGSISSAGGGAIQSLLGGSSGGATTKVLNPATGQIVPVANLGSGAIATGAGITTLGGANTMAGVGGGISGASVTGGPAGAGLGGGTAAAGGLSAAASAGIAGAILIGMKLAIDEIAGASSRDKALSDLQTAGPPVAGGLGLSTTAGSEFGFAAGATSGFAAQFAQSQGIEAGTIKEGGQETGLAVFPGLDLEQMLALLDQAQAAFEQTKALGVQAFGEIGDALNDGLIDRSEAAVLGLENIGEAYQHPETGAIELKEITAQQFREISAAIVAGELRLEALRDTTLLTAEEIRILGEIGVDAMTQAANGALAFAAAIDAIPSNKTVTITTKHVGGAGDPNAGTVTSVPGLAEGGLVTEPTLAVVGEAGPEVVIPLKNGRIQAELAERPREPEGRRRLGGREQMRLDDRTVHAIVRPIVEELRRGNDLVDRAGMQL